MKRLASFLHLISWNLLLFSRSVREPGAVGNVEKYCRLFAVRENSSPVSLPPSQRAQKPAPNFLRLLSISVPPDTGPGRLGTEPRFAERALRHLRSPGAQP